MKKITFHLFVAGVHLLLLTSILIFVLSACDDGAEEQGPPLAIESMTPTTARVGDTITITGTGFIAKPSRNDIGFTGRSSPIPAQVLEAAITSLKIKVPIEAMDGPIAITVGGKTVTTTQSFTVDNSLGAPTLASITPDLGFVNTEVTITGTNFGNDKSLVKVVFGTTEVTDILAMTATTIKVKVPVELPAGDVEIKVQREGKISGASVKFTVRAVPPIITTAYYTNGSNLFKGVIDKTGIHIDKLFDLGSNSSQCIVADFDGGYIYFGGPGVVMRAPVSGGNADAMEKIYIDALRLSAIGDIAVDHAANAIYFTCLDLPGEHAYIMKGNLDGTTPLTVLFDGTYDNIGFNLKLSPSTNTLYWAEPISQSIYSASLSGEFTPVLLFDAGDQLKGPVGIAIDEKHGKIYVTDNGQMIGTGGSSILTGQLDGTGTLSTLVPEGDHVRMPYDTEIDLVNGYVYWMNSLTINSTQDSDITRVKLDGTGIEVVFAGFKYGLGLTLDTR